MGTRWLRPTYYRIFNNAFGTQYCQQFKIGKLFFMYFFYDLSDTQHIARIAKHLIYTDCALCFRKILLKNSTVHGPTTKASCTRGQTSTCTRQTTKLETSMRLLRVAVRKMHKRKSGRNNYWKTVSIKLTDAGSSLFFNRLGLLQQSRRFDVRCNEWKKKKIETVAIIFTTAKTRCIPCDVVR